mmetsp:Transcript_157982/g.278906  ORF Transcript_157982/g.278906 Transcript_157982/m.278906 type:complete len:163 (+) Transcript_157982:66-554(+)
MGLSQARAQLARDNTGQACTCAENSSANIGGKQQHESIVLQICKAKGESYGFKLQWVLGPPRGLRILGVSRGSVVERLVQTQGISISRLVGGTIVTVNGVSHNRRLMDAELDRRNAELAIQVVVEETPLLRAEGTCDTDSPSIIGCTSGKMNAMATSEDAPS